MSFEPVLSASELPNNSRRCIVLPNGRRVLLVHHKNTIYCIDQACYHHGGPLATGDIEDFGAKIVISCPWHNYKIALENGEGLYMGLEVEDLTQPVLKSKGIKQRTHAVKIIDEMIYAQDSSLKDEVKIASDTYAFTKQVIPLNESGLVKLHSKMS